MKTSNAEIDVVRPLDGGDASLDVGELSLDEWQRFVDSHPRATAFHHRRWIETLAGQYGLRPFIPAAKSGGEVVVAVPFLAGRSLSGKKRFRSLPFTDCMQVLSWDEVATERLVSYLRTGPRPCHTMSIQTDRPLGGTAGPTAWVRHELTLGDSLAAIESGFPSSLKRNIRTAGRAGLEFSRRTDDAAMDAFYALHLETRREKGIPVQPRSYFRRLLHNVLQPGLGYVGVVADQGRPVAAAIYLQYGGAVIYKYGASAADSWRIAPTNG
ncbi:MAG: GNAT family N-acetyltransferase [Pirellulales bacterium]